MSKTNSDISKDFFSGEKILQGMPELAYVFDNENRMVLWNKNIELILGYTKDELYNKHVIDFIDIPDREKTIKTITKMYQEGTEQTIEYNLVTKLGEKLPYIGSGSLVNVNGQEFFTGMAISTKKLKDAENKLKLTIEEINRLKNQLQFENEYLRDEIKSGQNFNDITGESEALLNNIYQVKQVAPTNSPVLLIGESGTGKELFSRLLHSLSSRKNEPFIKINCTSLPSNMLESEFFGQAINNGIDQMGKLEIANNGTIFLDEISEIPINLQLKLLRVLQTGEFKKAGSSKNIFLNIRIISSTNQNIEDLIKKKLFLKELYFYLNIFSITIPPLRERISDLPLLVNSFVKHFNKKYSKQITKIPKKYIKMLQNYSWTGGNVRELENVIERAVILSNTSLLNQDQFVKFNPIKAEKILSLNDFEREYIIKVLNMTFWRVGGEKGAAKILGLHPETLRSRIRKLKIQRPKI